MKTLIVPAVSLLVGLAIGVCTGYRYYQGHVTNEAVKQMMETMESDDALAAVTAIRTIDLIESGQHDKASEYLTKPIVTYLHRFGQLSPTEQRTNVLQKIKAAAIQYTVVARALEQSTQ